MNKERGLQIYWRSKAGTKPVKLKYAHVEVNLLITILGEEMYCEMLKKGLIHESDIDLQVTIEKGKTKK